MQHGRLVYNQHYGLVRLRRKAIEQERGEWKMFQCLDIEEEVVAEIVVGKNPRRTWPNVGRI